MTMKNENENENGNENGNENDNIKLKIKNLDNFEDQFSYSLMFRS